MEKRIAVFPGSFDPITKGHEHIILRATQLFDEVVVAMGVNTNKKYLFSTEKRLEWLTKTFEGVDGVSVASYEGLTVDFCEKIGARFMLRGLRNSKDFEYEQTIAQMSRGLNPKIETILMCTDPEFGAINALVVREIIKNKGDVSAFVPDRINVYED